MSKSRRSHRDPKAREPPALAERPNGALPLLQKEPVAGLVEISAGGCWPVRGNHALQDRDPHLEVGARAPDQGAEEGIDRLQVGDGRKFRDARRIETARPGGEAARGLGFLGGWRGFEHGPILPGRSPAFSGANPRAGSPGFVASGLLGCRFDSAT